MVNNSQYAKSRHESAVHSALTLPHADGDSASSTTATVADTLQSMAQVRDMTKGARLRGGVGEREAHGLAGALQAHVRAGRHAVRSLNRQRTAHMSCTHSLHVCMTISIVVSVQVPLLAGTLVLHEEWSCVLPAC